MKYLIESEFVIAVQFGSSLEKSIIYSGLLGLFRDSIKSPWSLYKEV